MLFVKNANGKITVFDTITKTVHAAQKIDFAAAKEFMYHKETLLRFFDAKSTIFADFAAANYKVVCTNVDLVTLNKISHEVTQKKLSKLHR